jgi:choline dehydrogenase-like flavoprotein
MVPAAVGSLDRGQGRLPALRRLVPRRCRFFPNPLVTYWRCQEGRRVRPWSNVTRVLTNAQGTKVTGVEYYDQKKERQVQEASVVVLAAWAAQNPRLLLNSSTDKHPKGLANTNGLVGKYMMTHFSSGTLAIFDENVENHMGTTGAQYMSYERYGKTAHKGAFGSSFIVAGTALKTSDLGGFANARLDLFGPELAAFMKRAARGFSRIGAFGEEMPNIENRIELAGDKDEFGMPLGRIIHSYDDDVPKLWEANFAEGLAVAKAAGAKEMWSGRGNIPTIHLMGGTIMGTGPENSVVDSYGQTHEIPNLYMAGPGIFATSGASNPTYTIFALSLRGAEQLATKWSTVAG